MTPVHLQYFCCPNLLNSLINLPHQDPLGVTHARFNGTFFNNRGHTWAIVCCPLAAETTRASEGSFHGLPESRVQELKRKSGEKKKKSRKKKNTNLIGCPSDQVKDWALATRSGRRGKRREGEKQGEREIKKEKEKLPPSK